MARDSLTGWGSRRDGGSSQSQIEFRWPTMLRYSRDLGLGTWDLGPGTWFLLVVVGGWEVPLLKALRKAT